MFIKFYAWVTGENGREEVESCEAKNFYAAKDYFETLYTDSFTGELWEAEDEKE